MHLINLKLILLEMNGIVVIDSIDSIEIGVMIEIIDGVDGANFGVFLLGIELLWLAGLLLEGLLYLLWWGVWFILG